MKAKVGRNGKGIFSKFPMERPVPFDFPAEQPVWEGTPCVREPHFSLTKAPPAKRDG